MTEGRNGRRIELVVTDCDGTLLNPDKEVTPRSVEAVHALKDAGIRFTLSSSRPPDGIARYASLLDVIEPMGACNGALVVTPSLHAVRSTLLDAHVVPLVTAVLGDLGIDVWGYSASTWWVTDPSNPHTASETRNLGHGPVVATVEEISSQSLAKLVGVCDDPEVVAKAQEALSSLHDDTITAACSQDYYLDVTHAGASKGRSTLEIAQLTGVDASAIAVLGDGLNDISMFEVAGFSIAMGQGSETVRTAADAVASSNADEGFAEGVERFILGA